MPAPVLQIKRGAAGNIGFASLRAGEPGFTTDRYDFYIGLDATAANQKFFGSSRYWGREDGTLSSRLKLVDKTGIGGAIEFKAPNDHTGVTTYTFPSTASDGNFLRVAADGTLSWASVTSSTSFSNASLSGITSISGVLNNSANTSNSGITTFTNTTNNTLGNSSTGAVQIDGGLGVDGNVTINSNLYVQGQSEFVGVVTFRGGVINIGDGEGDTISIGGRFNSNLIPSQDNAYDVGISTLNWRNAHFSGIGTFETGAVVDGIQIGITANNEIDTTTGLGLVLDSATGQTTIDDNLFVTGIATVNGAFNANGNVALGDTEGDVITINGTTVNVNGANPTLASSSTGTLTLFNTNLTSVNAFGNATAVLIGASSGITTVRNSLRVTNQLYDSQNQAGTSGQFLTVTGTGIGWTTISGVAAGTISTATRSNTVDVNAATTQSGGIVFATAGNGATLYNDADLTYNSDTNVLSVPILTATTEVRTGAVKAGDGTSAITIANGTATVGVAGDLTVSGNLYVAGSTTQVNTTSLQIEDRVIELGKVQGTAPTDTTWDLGILFNYYTASSNKKASVYWENSASRFLFASDVTESVLGINLPDSGAVGLGTTTPQLTSPAFAPIEIGALWVNDTAGSSAVVSYLQLNDLYTGSPAGRYLHNVTVDAGTF